MNEREKLIELINQGREIGNCNKDECTDYFGEHCSECEVYDIAQTILADGWTRLPVIVGQKVWVLTTANWQRTEWKIVESKVSMLQQKADKSWKIRITQESSVYDITVDEIGKTVFLTSEDAERALAEKEKDNG